MCDSFVVLSSLSSYVVLTLVKSRIFFARLFLHLKTLLLGVDKANVL